jgi:hypothetical protein
MINQIVIYRYKTQFEGTLECKDHSKVVYTGDATTDLDPGDYTVTVDRQRKRYVVDKPRPKSQQEYRFVLDFDGVKDPFTLSYAPRIQLLIQGSGPQDDPFKEMLYGVGPDAYKDDASYIDNATGASFDLFSEELSVTYKDGSTIKLNLDMILDAINNPPFSGAVMYTYFKDLRTGKITPNLWDNHSVPNLAAMAADIQEQREQTMLFKQAMDAGITILGLMLVSLGALGALKAARPGGLGGGSGRRWQLRKPSPAQLAKGMAARIRAAGQKVVVNIGGEGEEVGAINVNIQRRLGKTEIENFVESDSANIGELFNHGSVDQIVSNRLPPNTLNWVRIIPGAHRVLKPGGRLVIKFQGVGQDAEIIMPLLKRYQFKQIKDWGSGAVFEAVK